MSQAIVICGLTCAGKSTISSVLSHLYDWDVVSFGKYIRYLSAQLGYPEERSNFQNIGQQILRNQGPYQFLEQVIQFNNPTSEVHIFDGARHTSVISEIRKIYGNIFVLYLYAKDVDRYYRYKHRENVPHFSFPDFLELDKHPTEYSIVDIKSIADICIDSSPPIVQIIGTVTYTLMGSGFGSS